MMTMPNRRFTLTVALILLAAAACLCSVTTDDGASASHTPARKRVMPWMCLERCGDNSTSITAQLHALAQHRELISGVSFELFNLGAEGTLVANNLTQVLPFLQTAGFKTYPMISSYPYPPQFLDWMRYVFDNPKPFITTCVQTAVKEGFSGYNVDWEPASGVPTADDAKRYAHFLTEFAEALHAAGKELTVDFAGWSTIWDYESLNASKADRLLCMGTYTPNFDSFLRQFQKAVASISLDKLGIGLETVNESENNRPLTDQEWEERFDMIIAKGIQEIDIWKTPIPDNMWKFIAKFVYSDTFASSA